MVAPRAGSTRRALLQRSGFAAGAGLLVSGCVEQLKQPVIVPRASPLSDIPVLNRLLALEREAVATYTATIPLLDGENASAATQFLGDEIAHANALVALIEHRDGTPAGPPVTYPIGSPPRSPAQALGILHAIERRQIDAYLREIPIVGSGRVRSVLSAILGSEAQHVAVLRGAQGERPMTGPFLSATA